MSLVLVWNDGATPYADIDLLKKATHIATSQTETFEISQAHMVTAFRLLVSRNIIDHTQITLRVQQLVVTFDRDGDLQFPAGFPVPQYANDLLCDLRMEVIWRKRAEKAAQVVD